MVTATKPCKPQAAPAPAAEPRPLAPAAIPDPLRPDFGDRAAFAVWLACALLMAALLTYDTAIGFFR